MHQVRHGVEIVIRLGDAADGGRVCAQVSHVQDREAHVGQETVVVVPVGVAQESGHGVVAGVGLLQVQTVLVEALRSETRPIIRRAPAGGGDRTQARRMPFAVCVVAHLLHGGLPRQQRVGLARGLAVDPDILLMDEAFSALDPLIRSEMQDELLKLQSEQQRTIVFISHDLDEALRIGDRIAIMEGGRVVQVGAPEEILQNPADDYVRAFFRGVDPTNVISAGDIARDTHPTIIKTKVGSIRAAHELLSGSERDHGYILDSHRKLIGVVSSDSLREIMEKSAPDNPIDQAFLENVTPVHLDDSMQEILPIVASNSWPVPVVNDKGVFKGVVSKNRFLNTLHRAEDGMNAQEEIQAA